MTNLHGPCEGKNKHHLSDHKKTRLWLGKGTRQDFFGRGEELAKTFFNKCCVLQFLKGQLSVTMHSCYDEFLLKIRNALHKHRIKPMGKSPQNCSREVLGAGPERIIPVSPATALQRIAWFYTGRPPLYALFSQLYWLHNELTPLTALCIYICYFQNLPFSLTRGRVRKLATIK